jgi:glycosyltransferase involved in cell wall biosynthesis
MDDDRTLRSPTLVPSVVVPNYNGARFLQQTLDSLAGQQSPELDVVIVDGASTDGSVEIIRQWADEHGATWVSEPDAGQAQAINKGFRIARGDIVTWINSDDLLHPLAVKHVIETFSRTPGLEFVWGFCLEIDADDNPIRITNPVVRPDLADLRKFRMFIPQPASWYRRNLLDRFGNLDENYHFAFDYELFLRFAGRTSARFLPEILAMFRIHPDSKTASRTEEFFPEAWRAFRSHGGSLRSPFLLDSIRDMWLQPLWRALTWPVRVSVRRAFGIGRGDRVRA